MKTIIEKICELFAKCCNRAMLFINEVIVNVRDFVLALSGHLELNSVI
jgi:hypothetical protein